MIMNNYNIEQLYYIHPNHYTDRKESITNIVNTINPKEKYRINSNKGESGIQQCAYAHLETIQNIIEKNIYPALILEDDVQFIEKTWQYKNNDADIVYLGASTWPTIDSLTIEEYDETYYRIYNMLSLHAYTIQNKNTAIKLEKLYKDSIINNVPIDVYIANASKDIVCVSPKDGLYFYQNNYNESVTRFKWSDYINK